MSKLKPNLAADDDGAEGYRSLPWRQHLTKALDSDRLAPADD